MQTVTLTAEQQAVFQAIEHTREHVFVKASFSERQARILRLDEPPRGIPTGAGYAEHLEVARALRERLIAMGYRPRDLFDVYSFSWKTLSDAAAKSTKPTSTEPGRDD